jgi:hypothetical protein
VAGYGQIDFQLARRSARNACESDKSPSTANLWIGLDKLGVTGSSPVPPVPASTTMCSGVDNIGPRFPTFNNTDTPNTIETVTLETDASAGRRTPCAHHPVRDAWRPVLRPRLRGG